GHRFASRAEHHRRAPNQFGVERIEEAVAFGEHDVMAWRGAEHGVVIDHARIAALPLDDLAELLDARARRDRLAYAALALIRGRHDAAEHEHARGETHRQPFQILRPAAFQRLDT